jgi:pSer/pThr/pTyr-binding forkhead associated (FHA) protein
MNSTIKLTLLKGNDVAGEYVFAGPARCVVGRAIECDIRVPAEAVSQDVSRRHCAIALDPPAVRVRDLGSLNGTRVNGIKISQEDSTLCAEESVDAASYWVELHSGDEVQLGQLTSLRVGVFPPPERAGRAVGARPRCV